MQENTIKAKRVSWLVFLLLLTYFVLLAILVFFPGSSLLERLRWLDSGICAQMPTHMFYPGGQSLPLCARNTGIYLGFILTLTTFYLTGRSRAQRFPPWPIMAFLLGGVTILAVDGFNSFALDLGLPHLYQPHNLLRLATGLITGLALAAISHPVINRLFWRVSNEQSSIPSWKMLLLLMPALILSFFATASQSWLVLYPLALLSTAGLLTALTSVNLLFIIAISKRDETFERYSQLLPFIGFACLLALAEMLILAQLRFILLQALGL